MKMRALDSNGDWTFGKGKANFLTFVDAINQSIQTRLKSFLGDCFFDSGAGIDWFTRLGENNDLTLQLEIGTILLNTYGVNGVLELSLTRDPETRALTLSYQVSTIYSVSVSGTVVQDVGG
jgi:hypothetical protein